MTVLCRTLLLGLLTLPILFLGCTEPEPDESATDQLRKTVNPKVGQFLIQGQRAYENGAYALALALSDSAEMLAPDLADIHYFRGVVYTQLNQLEVAQAAYEITLETDPDYKGARFNLGVNAMRRGKLRDAIDYYLAEAELENSSNLMLELGRAYAKLGEADSAKTAYQEALALDSTNATAYMWLGQLHEELGELDQALTYSKKGLSFRPDNLDYQYIIGTQHFRSDHIKDALKHLEPVALKRPWHHGAQYNYGQALLRAGREAEAQSFLTQADSAQQHQQQINEAQNQINREPDHQEHWITLSDLLRRSEQLDRAIESYKVAVSFEPWNLHLQNNLANLILESGDFPQAIRRYRGILRIDSMLVDVWLNLGVAHANAGEPNMARAAWNRTLSIQPGYPPAQSYLTQLDQPPN